MGLGKFNSDFVNKTLKLFQIFRLFGVARRGEHLFKTGG